MSNTVEGTPSAPLDLEAIECRMDPNRADVPYRFPVIEHDIRALLAEVRSQRETIAALRSVRQEHRATYTEIAEDLSDVFAGYGVTLEYDYDSGDANLEHEVRQCVAQVLQQRARPAAVEWVPVASGRLPDTDRTVDVTLRWPDNSRRLGEGRFNCGTWCTKDGVSFEDMFGPPRVIAWAERTVTPWEGNV